MRQKNHEISLLKTFQGFSIFLGTWSWLFQAEWLCNLATKLGWLFTLTLRKEIAMMGPLQEIQQVPRTPWDLASSPILVPIHRSAAGRLFLLVVECSHYRVFSDQSHSRASNFHTLNALFPASLSQSSVLPRYFVLASAHFHPHVSHILKGLIYSLVIRASCQI